MTRTCLSKIDSGLRPLTALLLLFFEFTFPKMVFSQSADNVYARHWHEASILKEQEHWDLALPFCDSLLIDASRLGNADSILSAYRMKLEVLAGMKDHARSVHFYQSYVTFRDSLNKINYKKLSDSAKMEISRLEEAARVSAIKYEEEIRQIQVSSERGFRIYLISLIAAVVLVSSVVLYLLRGQRQSRLESELWRTKVTQFEDFKERLFVILSQDIHLIMPRLDELGKRAANETESSDVLRLKSSISQLLQWVSLQSGAMSFHPQAFDYKSFLDERLKTYEAQFHAMGIHVEFFTPEALTVYADRQMLEIIFNQLITNALRFVGSGGSITFFAGQKDGLTTLGVRDTGKGIGKEELEGMFRRSGGSELDYQGQGLGLILCKDLIERHGGRMYVESTPGSGTSFYFTLPQDKKS